MCEDGRQQVCEQALLPVLVGLLREDDIEVQIHAAGVIMYVVVITPGTNTHLSVCAAEGSVFKLSVDAQRPPAVRQH